MAEKVSHPHRSVDSFVFLITCAFLIPPFVASLLPASRGAGVETAFTIFAPFAAAVVLVGFLFGIEFVEGRSADARPRWPTALVGIPIATVASGLSFSLVDPGHHWWRDGAAGIAWGLAAAVWGWRRWRDRATAKEIA